MIAASTPQPFVPFGRLHMKHIINIASVPSSSDETVAYMDSWKNKSQFVTEKGEEWILRLNSNGIEEELYVNGKSVIWSCGHFDDSRNNLSCRLLKQSFTLNNTVQQALWFKFRCDTVISKPASEVEEIDGVCVITSNEFCMFGLDIDSHETSFPFAVSKAWPSKYGLIFERAPAILFEDSFALHKSNLLDTLLPTLFAFTHPCNELSPIYMWRQTTSEDGMLSLAKGKLKIVFTSENPSICMLYEIQYGVHSMWKIRPASAEEIQIMKDAQECSMNSSSERSKVPSTTFFSENNHSKHHPKSDTQANSWIADSVGVPLTSIFHSSTSRSIFNRTDSFNFQQTRLNSTKFNRVNFALSGNQHAAINGELCFEHLWTENVEQMDKADVMNIARKTFIGDSFTDETFLYYLKSAMEELVCIRITVGDEDSDQYLTIGETKYIPAKDAEYLPSAKMVAIINNNGEVYLYTGATVIGHVIFGGVCTPQNITPSSSFMNASSPLRFIPTSRNRRSILSSTKIYEDASMVEDSFSFDTMSKIHNYTMSQTSSPTTSSRIQGIKSAIGWRAILVYDNNSLQEIKFPVLASSVFVERCIEVLKSTLPGDTVLTLLVSWYNTRNAPGTQDISSEQELQLFIEVLLRSLGYDISTVPLLRKLDKKRLETPVNPKKKKEMKTGSEADWTYLLNTSYHQRNCPRGCQWLRKEPNTSGQLSSYEINEEESELYTHFYKIFYALHLLYEDLKLDTSSKVLPAFASFLYQLAADLNLDNYRFHYFNDFPRNLICDTKKVCASNSQMLQMNIPDYIRKRVPNIFEYVHHLLTKSKKNISPFPHINKVNDYSAVIIQLIGLYENEFVCYDELIKEIEPENVTSRTNSVQNLILAYSLLPKSNNYHRIITLTIKSGLTLEKINTLPVGIAWYFANLIYICRHDPPQNLSDEEYLFLKREDLSPRSDTFVRDLCAATPSLANVLKSATTTWEETEMFDGMDNLSDRITDLLWDSDDRQERVRSLLRSSTPFIVNLSPYNLDVNSHEYVEQQERCLFSRMSRILSLPVGRGMFTLGTIQANNIEPLSIPKLCTVGKSAVTGMVIDFSHMDVAPNISVWSSFHNGVAAGLRISPTSVDINYSWISFNKAKNIDAENVPEHAGYLMGIGLNGFLTKLRKVQMYEYLALYPDLISMAVIIGLAASLRGTQDLTLTKVLSVHIDSLLPPTTMELEIEHKVQIASLMGIGLVYMGSGNVRMIDVLLNEIDRPPRTESGNYRRESHSLTAGFGLGLILLGRGSNMPTKSNHVVNILRAYMVGGARLNIDSGGYTKDRSSVQNNRIQEGNCINTDVTAPAVVAALGLIYFNTNDATVGEWLSIPSTKHGLEDIRPDLLLERTLAYNLIFWNKIRPTVDWVESNVPPEVNSHCLMKPAKDSSIKKETLETINQAFCNIVSGACLALAFRYAGSSDPDAMYTVRRFCILFQSLTKKSLSDLIGKPTIETAIDVTLISFAIVVAGTGNKDIVKMCAKLAKRIGQPLLGHTYGSFMAIHMALGLAFLGNGRYSLSSTPESVAAMLIAFYPKFPLYSTDNRYHLQAFRHLYVLAAEPRLIIPRNIDTGELISVGLEYVFIDEGSGTTRVQNRIAPFILPELRTLERVKVLDNNYLPIVFNNEENFDCLRNIMKTSYLNVKPRMRISSPKDIWQKSLSVRHDYKKDANDVFPWSTVDEAIGSCTNLPNWVAQFKLTISMNTMKSQTKSPEEHMVFNLLKTAVIECLSDDKIYTLPYWFGIVKVLRDLYKMPTSNCVWQIKLFLSVIDETIHLRNDLDMNETAMVNPKFHAIRETEPLPTPSYRIIQKNSYMITPNEFVVSRRLALIVKELTERYLDFHNAKYGVNVEMDTNSILESGADSIVGCVKSASFTQIGLSPTMPDICATTQVVHSDDTMFGITNEMSKKTLADLMTQDKMSTEALHHYLLRKESHV